MALFGKQDPVACALKKIQSAESFGPGEPESLFEAIVLDPEFQVERNTWLFFHGDYKVRQFASAQYRLRHSPASADVLIKDLPGKPAAMRQELARLIAEAEPNRVYANLGRLIHSTAKGPRDAAVDLMGALGPHQDLIPHLKVTLRDADPGIRHRTARILARALDNPVIFLLLRDLVNDADDTLRQIILEAFVRRPAPEMVEAFFERLLENDPRERDVILSALRTLARSKQDRVADRILPMLSNDKDDIREVAARLLSEMPNRVSVLRAFLVHCRGLAFWLRERSIQSIHKVSDGLVEPLMELMRDEDEDIRVGAMLLASGSKDERLVPLIQEIFLGKGEWWIRSMAAEALNGFASEDVTDILLERLEDSDLYYSIISSLGSREDQKSHQALLACLQSPARGIRVAAIGALGARKSPEALSAICRIAEFDKDPSVRERALDELPVLGELGTARVEAIARRRKASETEAVLVSELQMENEDLNPKSAAAKPESVATSPVGEAIVPAGSNTRR
jgi:HEAT repeat protein